MSIYVRVNASIDWAVNNIIVLIRLPVTLKTGGLRGGGVGAAAFNILEQSHVTTWLESRSNHKLHYHFK